MTPRALVVQHESICPPARVGSWLAGRGLAVDVVRPYEGDQLPDVLEHDALVVLGGTMGANDDAEHWWLAPTKRLLAAAVEAGVPTLGICLGHQLLAVACGGTVRPNPGGATTGLQAVAPAPDAADDPLRTGSAPGTVAIHWNDDVVTDVPAGADVLSTTPDGSPQVIRVGPTAWGVQFHPEADLVVVQVWADRTVADRSMTRAAADHELRRIAAADGELVARWQTWTQRFADLALSRRRPGAAPR